LRGYYVKEFPPVKVGIFKIYQLDLEQAKYQPRLSTSVGIPKTFLAKSSANWYPETKYQA
jgi:hypothetical protein